MAKYSEKAGKEVEKKMHELKRGKLKSSTGAKVKSREQAIAIGLSEAREKGYKAPPKKGAKKAAKGAKKVAKGAKKAGRQTAAKKTSRKTSRKRKSPVK